MTYIRVAVTGLLLVHAAYLFIGIKVWSIFRRNKPKMVATKNKLAEALQAAGAQLEA